MDTSTDGTRTGMSAAPEMQHPDNIVGDRTAAGKSPSKAKRDLESMQTKRNDAKLDAIRTGGLGDLLKWVKPCDLPQEIEFLNKCYHEFVAMGDTESFDKLIAASRNELEYKAAKKRTKTRLSDRSKVGRILLKIMIPLCYIASFLRQSGNTTETVVVDQQYDSTQTMREFKRTEEMLKFEHRSSLLRVQLCSCCRENHLNELTKEPRAGETYTCLSCKKQDNQNYYLEKKLQPIWYERKSNAKSHKDYKIDSNGNRIVRYDQPLELTTLTMSEQLLIRRCAPYIPTIHFGKGFYGVKGHCVAFPQDITDMCNVLPQRPEKVVTYIRQMGNKDTSDVYLKHLRVRKQKVLTALKWLKLHHSGYYDIQIDPSKLDWMKGQSEAVVDAKKCNVTVTERHVSDNREFVSRVQCAGDIMRNDELNFSTLALSDVHTVPNADQSQPVTELANIAKETNQSDKLLMFPPHGDTPVK